jgi:hypothetical protein
MPFVQYPQQILGMKIQKRLGKPCMCGYIIPGWSEMGDDNEFSAQYAQRRHRKGNGKLVPPTYGTPKNFYMRPYWPTQPPSDARNAQQEKLHQAVHSWQALTYSQKQAYNAIAIRYNRRGYNYFISQTIKS